MGLLEGDYRIEILDGTEAVVDTRLVHVAPAAVATLDFELGRAKTLYIKYFDPLKQTPQRFEYVSLGGKHSSSGETETSVPLQVYAGSDPLLLFARTDKSPVESATFPPLAQVPRATCAQSRVVFEFTTTL